MKWSVGGGGGRGADATSSTSQVVPSSQHPCGRDHHDHHLVQPVLLLRRCPQLQAPTPWQGEGLGGVLDSARRGLRTKEAREDWEERKGKKTTPEGSKFLTFSPPPLLWMITMNFVRESESCLHYCFLCDMIFHSVVSRIPCDQGGSRNMLWRIYIIHWWIKIVKDLSFVKAWVNKR